MRTLWVTELVLVAAAALLYSTPRAHAARWFAQAPLHVAREYHTATLLPNGKVLVVGGGASGSVLSSAELYDPATGQWTLTGSLTTPREYHTASLLADGTVLVVGGSFRATAEIYNPATGSWTPTGSLQTARQWHTATVLPDGRVLVAGGYSQPAMGWLSSAELYDPQTGTWTPTGSLTVPRYEHTATLLGNGKVLAAGGRSTTGSLPTSTELYDPGTGLWTATGALSVGREYHSASLLSNGDVLVAGGYYGTGVPYATVSAYRTSRSGGAWWTMPALATGRSSHTATVLTNGLLLAAGGWSASGFTSTAELYTPATGAWTNTAALLTARDWHTATLLTNGNVLVAGGAGATGILGSVELFDLQASPGPVAIVLAGAKSLPDGTFCLSFTNTPGAVFSVFGATNPAVPLASWTLLGAATELSPGQFGFTDLRATNLPGCFYRVSSP